MSERRRIRLPFTLLGTPSLILGCSGGGGGGTSGPTQGTACVWLVNNELGGTVKEVDGVVAW